MSNVKDFGLEKCGSLYEKEDIKSTEGRQFDIENIKDVSVVEGNKHPQKKICRSEKNSRLKVYIGNESNKSSSQI